MEWIILDLFGFEVFLEFERDGEVRCIVKDTPKTIPCFFEFGAREESLGFFDEWFDFTVEDTGSERDGWFVCGAIFGDFAEECICLFGALSAEECFGFGEDAERVDLFAHARYVAIKDLCKRSIFGDFLFGFFFFCNIEFL